MLRLKTILFFLAAVFFSSVPFAGEVSPAPAEKAEEIRVSLNTDTEINNALTEIKNDSPQDFDMLKEIQAKDKESFRAKLHNRYYTLLHKKMLLRKRKLPEKGYRELVRESEGLFSDLQKKYAAADEAGKKAVGKEISQAAEKRFEIELDQLRRKEERARKYCELLSQKREKFEKEKQNQIQRMISRCESRS